MRKIILLTLTMLLGFFVNGQVTTIYRNGKTSVNDFSIRNNQISINGSNPVTLHNLTIRDNLLKADIYMQKSETKFVMVSTPKANTTGFWVRIEIEFYPEAKSIKVYRGNRLVENFDNDLNN